MYEKYFKRLLDFILSITAIIILSPILLLIALLVKIILGSPILFKQKRPGLNEKIFTIYKFRSMTDARDQSGNLLSDQERLHRLGKFLRSTSIDELPSLFNILKGDMSIVGPRPLLVQYLSLYNYEQRKRHNVRPGLTGLAQINGRNAISWKEKFFLDVKYVNNIHFINDVVIVLHTIKKVILRKDIDADNSTTMEPFRGN